MQLPTLAVVAMALTNTPWITCVAPVAVTSWEIPAGTVPLVAQPVLWVAAPSRYLSPLTMTGVTPGDSQLSVSVAAGTATATETATRSVTYRVTCTPSAGGGAPSTGGPSNVGSVICAGLTNSTPYTVTAQASSQAGNSSAVSDVTGPNASTTPLPFLDFWQVYKDQGGVEQGGCSTGSAGALAPALVLLGLLAVRRRRS